MTFAILTLFPELIEPILTGSVLGRALENGVVHIDLCNLRNWTTDRHKTVDDTPYGGGPGMVLRVDVIDRAIAALRQTYPTAVVILLTPQGARFTQERAETLAAAGRDIILVAGHYEGFDERVRQLVDQELSLGDFVLTGGELAAAAVVDAVTRLLPGALGDDLSAHEESHSLRDVDGTRLLEYPHYTRPERYTPESAGVGELAVPDVLKSGNHARINAWRRDQARQRTRRASSVDTPGVNR